MPLFSIGVMAHIAVPVNPVPARFPDRKYNFDITGSRLNSGVHCYLAEAAVIPVNGDTFLTAVRAADNQGVTPAHTGKIRTL